MRPIYHVFVWGLAAVTTAIAWGQGQFGPSSDGTCWIEDDNSPYRLLFYIPLSFYMIASVLLLILLIRERKRLRYGTGSTFPRMVAFTAVFVLVWVWSLLFRAAEADNSSPESLSYMHAFFVSGQAFFNFCVWITSPAFQTCSLTLILRRALFGSLAFDSGSKQKKAGGGGGGGDGDVGGGGTDSNTTNSNTSGGSNTASEADSVPNSDIESGASSQRHSMSVRGDHSLSRIASTGVLNVDGGGGVGAGFGAVFLGGGGTRYVRMDEDEEEMEHELNVMRAATIGGDVTEMYYQPPLVTSSSKSLNHQPPLVTSNSKSLNYQPPLVSSSSRSLNYQPLGTSKIYHK